MSDSKTGKADACFEAVFISKVSQSPCWRQGQGGAETPATGEDQVRELEEAWGKLTIQADGD